MSADTKRTNGQSGAEEKARLLKAMKDSYNFPGKYPITLIANGDLKFFAQLNAALEELLGTSDFDIRQRDSSKKNYVSYRITIHVESAEEALEHKEFLRTMEGVLLML